MIPLVSLCSTLKKESIFSNWNLEIEVELHAVMNNSNQIQGQTGLQKKNKEERAYFGGCLCVAIKNALFNWYGWVEGDTYDIIRIKHSFPFNRLIQQFHIY